MQSFFTGMFRRKRAIGTFLGICASLFILNHFFSGGIMSLIGGDDVTPLDEFQGFIYYLTKSDKLLPAQMEVVEPQDPAVWNDGKPLTPSEWAARLAVMRNKYPVIVFSKTYCPYSKRAKAILAEYDLKKPPVFIEADIRPDGPKIKGLLNRLTGQATFPNVVIGGRSIGGADRTEIMHNSGALSKRLKAAGAI